MTNNAHVNKYLYKIFLVGLKFTPITLFIIFIIGFILNIFGIPTFWVTWIGGTSLITLTLLYVLSYLFKFCYLFRIPLHYITVVNAIAIINKIFVLSSSAIFMLHIYFILAGITLVIFIYYIYKNRNNPQPDPIIELCKKYCDINCGC
jgi:hypothetical protein